MSDLKTLTFAFMDPPFESERTVTFFRLLDAALERGASVRVFAYEGAVALAFARQAPHGNAVHGRDAAEEDHPLTREWIRALQEKAAAKELGFEWINCGLCVDERGVNDVIDGCGRGGPPDLWRYASDAFNTLTIGTR
ncbi:iron-sulfur binding domain-containing protein [Alcanivorax balearicus MACL04]|uniref:Iron-sulfur binding domain-containing protein n=1 Tax=Alloalcanivorax balearicus MACL04 TaxID=1177182 RepID=A0ABT2QY43_9GAMM|nr:DsrE family protein [Alloalcanivorax balearicus]MCU5782432.1 iron-sulfur binding domain-containing protein [Alloalcanivorax balearicus MACL04]